MHIEPYLISPFVILQLTIFNWNIVIMMPAAGARFRICESNTLDNFKLLPKFLLIYSHALLYSTYRMPMIAYNYNRRFASVARTWLLAINVRSFCFVSMLFHYFIAVLTVFHAVW